MTKDQHAENADTEIVENPAAHQYTVSIDNVTDDLMACTCPHHVHHNAATTTEHIFLAPARCGTFI